MIYNILNDFTTETEATNKNHIGQNADPSCKFYSSKSGARRRCGFPIGEFLILSLQMTRMIILLEIGLDFFKDPHR